MQGRWILDPGSWQVDPGSGCTWIQVHGRWILDLDTPGSRATVARTVLMMVGSRIQFVKRSVIW